MRVITFVSDPEAPLLSVTVTVMVRVLSSPKYECPALIVPGLDALPVDVEPSPQLMV
jgi:hypothetical protein